MPPTEYAGMWTAAAALAAAPGAGCQWRCGCGDVDADVEAEAGAGAATDRGEGEGARPRREAGRLAVGLAAQQASTMAWSTRVANASNDGCVSMRMCG